MFQNVTVPQMVVVILLSLAGFTMGLIAMTHIYVWLCDRTNSIFLAILFHALSNLFGYWLTSFLADPSQASAISVLSALIPWLIVIVLTKRYGKELFTGSPAHERNGSS